MQNILIRKGLILGIFSLMIIGNIQATISITYHVNQITGDESGTYLISEINTTHYNFLNGTFDLTNFDYSIDAIVLNNSKTGNYTSQIFDVYSIVTWNNISWVSNAIGELPNNRQTENKPGGVDMTDNEVLFHFNNQSEYNENYTYLYDFSGSGHFGNNSALLVSNGKLGGGIEFDGVSDHRIFIKDGMEFWDNASNWSVVMWIYARSSEKNIIGKRDDGVPWIWIGDNYKIEFSTYYGLYPPYEETLPYAVDPNKWTHLSMTRNGTNISVYKNGILHTSLTATTNQNGDRPGVGDLQIGAYNVDQYRLNGLLDELAFFSRTLTYDEIKNMYKRGVIKLNVSVSSCDDADCVGENWIDINDTSPQNLSIPDNQYFKYKFTFETDNISYSPELYNVTIRFTTTSTDDIPPEIKNITDYPDPQYIGGYVNITCDVSDNVAVDEVHVNITYPDNSYHNETMLGGSYYYNTTYTQIGNYEYFIWANDTNSNSNVSDYYSFEIVNNPPNTPSDPYPEDGATNVNVNVMLSWTCSDPDGDPLTYDVYFGTTSPPPKVVANQSETKYSPDTLETNTKYYWKIVAWDNHGDYSEGSIWSFTTEINSPPQIPKIDGPKFGKPGIEYSYQTSSTDPEGDPVYYKWNWGDQNYSVWLGPFDSGEVIFAFHSWSNGVYNIEVMAKDSYGGISNWSEPLTVVIEDEPPDVQITKPEKAIYIVNRKILPRIFSKALIIGKIDITVEALDDLSGINRVEFYIDNDLKSVDNSSPYVHTWTRDKITLFKHKHEIKVVAFDNAGNIANDEIIVKKFL